jgi:monovalent cation/hydrogen antiporter
MTLQQDLIFGLVLLALVIALLARRLDKPYPIALVLGGVAVALIPGVPVFRLDPHLVFVLLLPPILGEASYYTSWRDFRSLSRAISLLAFGLVAATSAVVAAICMWLVPGMNWATGFLLGAIVSPPDAAAATSITRGLGLPRRVVTILEGESLINDASALVLYRFSLAAILSGTFSWAEAALGLLWISLAGVAIGWLLGQLYVRIYPKLKDPDIEILSTFLLSYSAYLVAEAVHASGVLATVTAGLIWGWHSPTMASAAMRIRANAVWQSLIFVINVLVFFLIGLQFPAAMAGLAGRPLKVVLLLAAAVTAGVILIRLAWVFPGAWLPHLLSRRIRDTEARPQWKSIFLVGWTGLRGVVSLAAALALPLNLPHRDLILFLTFIVILATLLLQGLSLRTVVCWMGLDRDMSSEQEQLRARLHATEAVLEHLEKSKGDDPHLTQAINRVSGYFEDRLASLRESLARELGEESTEQPGAFVSLAEQKLWWEAVRVERAAVLRLRHQKTIGDEALRHIEQEIDLVEARLVPGSASGPGL